MGFIGACQKKITYKNLQKETGNKVSRDSQESEGTF